MVITDNLEKKDASPTKSDEKKTRVFDLDKLVLEARETAKERCKDNQPVIQNDVQSFPLIDNITINASEDDSSDSGTFGPKPLVYDNEQDDSSNDECNVEHDDYTLPINNAITLTHGTKAISAMAIDSTGNRLALGSFDCEVSLWNFTTMDASLTNYRKHQIRYLDYDSNNDRILVISGSAQAKILSKDGRPISECIKGDQYISDMGNTKGHVAMLNCGVWNPIKGDQFVTGSNDCTMRIWNVNNVAVKHENLIRFKNSRISRNVPTAATISQDGNMLLAATADGHVQFWDLRKRFVYPEKKLAAHKPSKNGVTCVKYSQDGVYIATRGDSTIKVWDARKMTDSLFTKCELPNPFAMANCEFSPNESYIIVPVSSNDQCTKGALKCFDINSGNSIFVKKSENKCPVMCNWHPRLNQIIVGCSDGQVVVFYDEKKSLNGATLFVHKQPKARKNDNYVAAQKEKSTSGKQKVYERLRKNKALSMQPELPMDGPGSGGRLAKRGGTLSKYVVQQLCLKNDDAGDRDPRGAILRHSKAAEENPMWVAPAYKKTQPKSIFQKRTDKDDNDSSTNSKQLKND